MIKTPITSRLNAPAVAGGYGLKGSPNRYTNTTISTSYDETNRAEKYHGFSIYSPGVKRQFSLR